MNSILLMIILIFLIIICLLLLRIYFIRKSLKNIENTFQSFFGSKVRLDAGRRRGKIIIEYTSNDDLERILDLIK